MLSPPVAGLVALLAAVLDITRRGCSDDLTWPQALRLYARKVKRALKTRWLHRQFVRDTTNFAQCQADLLLNLLRAHEKTGYGRDHQFASIQSVEEFRRSHPITEYDHFKDYIDRAAAGETSAMLADDETVAIFSQTSGTTGANKRFPITKRSSHRFIEIQLNHGPHQLAQARDIAPWDLRNSVFVAITQPPKYTISGHFQSGGSKLLVDSTNRLTTPEVADQVMTEFESHYLHALFGLRDKKLGSISAVFLSFVLSLLKRMEEHQDDLVADIRRGRVKEDLAIDADIRTKLNALLTPMPTRAEEVRAAFAGGSDGLVPRLWPELKFIMGAHGGITNAMYYQKALQYCGASVPIITYVYSSSDVGIIGVPTDFGCLERPVFTLLPDACFFEFLPMLDGRAKTLEEITREELLLSHQLEVGGEYELITTTRTGLYRYRFGDVLRVVGFYHHAPRVEFAYRAGQLLNIDDEKVSEKAFFESVDEARSQWPPEVVVKEYTVADSRLAPAPHSSGDPHYMLFLELDGPRLTEGQTQLVDGCLRGRHERYAGHRCLGRLGPIAVFQLPAGTFERFRAHLVETTPVTPNQFKVPRVLKSGDRVQWFLDSMEG